jgi:predicted nucleic acid-binding protein
MIIADTSVWIYHFRHGSPHFAQTLQKGLMAIHPIVLGELATGNLLNRAKTIAALRCLPKTQTGTVEECMQFIEIHGLYGRGIGWNDIQILVAARLSGNLLWSRDRRLDDAAKELGISYLDH